ncbi:MAG: SDR family oxidoreductase [Gemmatimonadota bacterium]|nr:SDR family oxidoreductase [Gemmatimonadota bacterium]MDH5284384.1 SDR family oxidoreductase [Gemmatimonadota bacterium]
MERRILLTGATGYVGGRLLAALEREGRIVRCLARRPEFLRQRAAASTEVVAGDVLDPGTLPAALQNVDTAFYLVHSMGSSESFEDADRTAAENFARAARDAGVRRVIYLGGLGQGGDLSPHLVSRQQVGQILRQSGVPTVELRASIILGSGSVSFDMIRSLVETLPVMITPSWVATPTQPIGIEDVIAYLREAIDLPPAGNAVFEIGGPDRVSYGDLMREYARQRGLRRLLIPVPLLTPRLSSLWLRLVTPVYARVGRALVDGLRNETVVRDDAAARAFAVRPLGMRQAMARALANEDQEFAATHWSDALSSAGPSHRWGGVRFGTRLVDTRSVTVNCAPAEAFAPIRRIGGQNGWYHANLLWRIRGAIDLLAGGPGLRRGRRNAEQLSPGDPLDFWRVEAVEPDRLLRLHAEMRLPGRAWLQFEVSSSEGRTVIHQTALFDPLGLLGQAYWYALWPVHQYVFGGMLGAIARAATAGRP